MTGKTNVAIGLFLAVLLLTGAVHAETLFLAHYNGDTGNSGCDADYAVGSTTAATSSGGYPSINTTTWKFGNGALDEDWWSGRSLQYSSTDNLNLATGTIEFFLDTSAGYYDGGSGTYLYDGNRRYVMQNDIGWGVSGHIDMWFEGTAGAETARLVVHIAGSRSGTPFTLTLLGAPMYYTEVFTHYAIEWDSAAGTAAVFTSGILRDKENVDAWDMTGTSSIFKLGMESGNIGENILDEMRISSEAIYDSSVSVGTKSFDVPTSEFPIPEPISAIILGIGALMITKRTNLKLK